jgi:hypothetical protein
MYEAQPVTIDEPAILIRLNQRYRYGMSDLELYEITRGGWKVSPERHHPQYAFAVYRGVVQEVYWIECWQRAGTAPYRTRTDVKVESRGSLGVCGVCYPSWHTACGG